MAELFDRVLRFAGGDRSVGAVCAEFNIAPAAAAKIAVGLAAPALLANLERMTYSAGSDEWIEGLLRVQPLTSKEFQLLTHHPDYCDFGEEGAKLVLGPRHDRVVRMVAERSEITAAGADGVLAATMWVIVAELGDMQRQGASVDAAVDAVRAESADLASTGWGPWLQATADARDVGTLAVPTPAGVMSASPVRHYPPPVTADARHGGDEANSAPMPRPVVRSVAVDQGDLASGPSAGAGGGIAIGRGTPGDRRGEPAWDSTSAERVEARRPWRRIWLIVALALVLGLFAGAAYRRVVGSGGDEPSTDDAAADVSADGDRTTEGADADGAGASGEAPSDESDADLVANLQLDLSDPLGLTPATGTAVLNMDRGAAEVCYEFDVEGLEAPFKGHIHVGPAGVKGGIVVDFGVLSATPAGCVPVNALDIDLIRADPAGHYVELHDADDVLTIRNQLDKATGDTEALAISPGPTEADTDGAYVALESGRLVLRGEVPDSETEEKLFATFEDLGLEETRVVSELTIVPGAPRPSGRIVVTEAIVFETNSATLSDEDDQVFTDLAAIFAARPAWSMEIVGHTDATGNDVINLELSLKRAESVRDVLVQRGVSPEVLAVRGAGSTDPVADNSSAAGRAQNRRIEFQIVAG